LASTNLPHDKENKNIRPAIAPNPA